MHEYSVVADPDHTVLNCTTVDDVFEDEPVILMDVNDIIDENFTIDTEEKPSGILKHKNKYIKLGELTKDDFFEVPFTSNMRVTNISDHGDYIILISNKTLLLDIEDDEGNGRKLEFKFVYTVHADNDPYKEIDAIRNHVQRINDIKEKRRLDAEREDNLYLEAQKFIRSIRE